MRRYLAEGLGTFGLVFCGTGAIVIDHVSGGAVTHTGIAVTFGLVVTAMIFAFGEISGAHLNPAVTIGMVVAKRLPVKDLVPYIIAQIAGAFAASGLLRALFPQEAFLGATMPSGSEMQSFWLEIVLTFVLMTVILGATTGSKEKAALGGIAIGAVVLLEAMFAGPVTGASMNPARSLAPAVVSGELSHLWIYLAAPVAGALVAVFVWQIIKPK